MMKKITLLVMIAVVLVSTFWVSTHSARAAGLITYRGGVFVEGKGISFVFDAPGYRNRDVRGADIFVHSSVYDLGCTVNREEEKIVCVLRGGLTEYAGETGIIYLAGQVFYVTIPDRNVVEEEEYAEESGSCEDWGWFGAWVTFEYLEGEEYSEEFIEGESQEEVDAIAAQMAAEDESITDYEVGEFGCYEFEEELPEEELVELQ
jgi:hypothetical protein